MGVVNTGKIAKALRPGVNKFYGEGYKQHDLELSKIFDKETSSMSYEEDVQLVGTGLVPKKPEGSPTSYDEIRQGFVTRYTHIAYSLGIIFTREMLKDGRYELGLKNAKYLGKSVRQTRETIAANVLNRAFNSSYTGGDSKELCATDHPNISGGTYSNKLSTPADLNHESLEQMLIDIDNQTDDRGLKIATRGTKLIIPTALRFTAARILKSVQESGNANNDINAIHSEADLQMVVNHYLSDSDAWFVKTDCMDGLKHFEREAPGNPGDDTDFDTDNVKFKIYFRESYGWTDPRGIHGSAGS